MIKAYRRLGSITGVAQDLGISVGLATAVLADGGVEIGRNQPRSTAPLRPKVTAQFCVEVLREAARQGDGTISEKRYQAMLRGGVSTEGQPWPWPSTLLSRLGARTWNQALVVAGIPDLAPGAGSRGVGNERLVAMVIDLRTALGRPPTRGSLEKLQRMWVSREFQSIKRRFGSWDAFIATALASSGPGFRTLASASESGRPP